MRKTSTLGSTEIIGKKNSQLVLRCVVLQVFIFAFLIWCWLIKSMTGCIECILLHGVDWEAPSMHRIPWSIVSAVFVFRSRLSQQIQYMCQALYKRSGIADVDPGELSCYCIHRQETNWKLQMSARAFGILSHTKAQGWHEHHWSHYGQVS